MTMRWQALAWEYPNGNGDVATIPPIGAKVAAWFCRTVQLFTVKMGKPKPAPTEGTWYRVAFVAHVPADRTLLEPNHLALLAAGVHLGHVYGFDLMDDWQVRVIAHRDTPWPPVVVKPAEPGPCAESGCWLLSMGTTTRPEPTPPEDDDAGRGGA